MQSLLDQLWELDTENSFARMTITPIKEGGKLKYLWEKEMWIKPYPNPFGYGGYWAQGVAKTTEEVDRLISYFKSEAERWGLCKINIIRQPEMTRVKYNNLKRQEWLERDIRAGKKADNKVAQLTLM